MWLCHTISDCYSNHSCVHVTIINIKTIAAAGSYSAWFTRVRPCGISPEVQVQSSVIIYVHDHLELMRALLVLIK